MNTAESIIMASVITMAVMFSTQTESAAENLIAEDSSFETGYLPHMVGECGAPIERAFDTATGFDGTHSLKMRFSGDAFTRGKTVAATPGKKYTLSLYAKSEKDGVNGSLRLVSAKWDDNQGEKISIGREWKRYSVTITARAKEYWLGFQLGEAGIVWLDAVQFEEGGLTPYVNAKQEALGISIPSSYANLFLTGEKVPVNICYFNQAEPCPDSLTVSCLITDLDGKTVISETQDANLDQDGRFEASFSLKPERLGLYTCRAEVKTARELLAATNLTTFAVVDPPVEIKAGIEPFCGIDSRMMPEDISTKLSFPWMEWLVQWDQLEPQKGRFLWPEVGSDKIFSFKKRGYKVKLIVWSSPEWSWDEAEVAECKAKGIPVWTGAAPGLFPKLKDWQNFIHALAVHYKDVVDIWEIWGEVELTMGSHNAYYKYKYPDAITNTFVCGPVAERYAEMVKAASQEIKSVNPYAKIGAIRPCNVDIGRDFTFSREVFKKAGKDFDVFPLDPYCTPWKIGPSLSWGEPEKLFDTFKRAFELIRQYGRDQHVYISEIGWPLDRSVAPDSVYAKAQAAILAKTYLIARMTEGVDLCQWLVLRDVGPESIADTAMGIWHLNGYPMPAVPAYSVVSRVVENVIESRRINLGPDVVAAVFRKQDSADAVIWIKGDDAKVTIKSNDSISIFDLMGNPVKTEVKGKEIALTVGEAPVYFSQKGRKAFRRLCKTMSSAHLQIKPVELSFNMPGMDKGVVCLRNRTQRTLDVDISLFMPGNEKLTKNARISGATNLQINFTLPDRLAQAKGDSIIVQAGCEEFDKASVSFPLQWETCKKIVSPVKVDGDLAEWSSRPYILMDKREQIIPPHKVNWYGTEDLSAKVYLGWDETNFYFAAEVADDKHFNTREGIMIWNGDSIQFAFDPRLNGNQKKEAGWDFDDYNLGLALTATGPAAFVWNGPDKKLWEKSEYSVKRDEKNKKTIYEAKIPFSVLGVVPKAGKSMFGFSFVIFDDDDGAGQTYYYQLTPGITESVKPGSFKRFLLSDQEDGKLAK